MVQLPSSGKRHAEPAEPAMAPARRAAVKLEVEELGADERGPLSKRAKAAQPMPPTPPQPQQVDPGSSCFSYGILVCSVGSELASELVSPCLILMPIGGVPLRFFGLLSLAWYFRESRSALL